MDLYHCSHISRYISLSIPDIGIIRGTQGIHKLQKFAIKIRVPFSSIYHSYTINYNIDPLALNINPVHSSPLYVMRRTGSDPVSRVFRTP